MNQEWCDLIKSYLEDLRVDIRGLRKEFQASREDIHRTRLACVRTFATKSYVRSIAYLLTILIVVATFHPDALKDIIQGVRGLVN